MHLRFLILTVLLSLIPLTNISAHPHMWIRGTVTPVLSEHGLSAVDVTWKFDEYSNSRFIEDYDTDSNRQISQSESEAIRTESLSLLFQSEYYLVVDIDGIRGTPMEAVNFGAAIEDGQLIYTFRVPLEITIRWEDMNKVGIYLYDPTYFVDFRNDGMTNLTVAAGDRTVNFTIAERDCETSSYGYQ